MDTLFSFLIAAVLTFYFVRRYLKRIAGEAAKTKSSGSAQISGSPCPRCGAPLLSGSSFCSRCGAALALWNVHRAQVKVTTGDGARQEKPRPVIDAAVCMGCHSCVDSCPEKGALELVGGKSNLVHPELCTGQALCAKACPTGALSLAFGGLVTQTLKVPLVNENFETNVSGVYIVGELGGMGMIKTAINEGKLVIDHVRQRLAEEKQAAPAPPAASDGNAVYDVLIVGSGPAGLSASLTAHQHGLQYLTLEQGEIASTIRQYPRHKFLMAEPIQMPLYGTLYIADGAKESLLTVWETIITNTGVHIQTNERVTRVKMNGGNFEVETNKSRYHARRVVLAMGKRGTPRRLGVPGEELGKVAYRLIEAASYQDRNILVVGGGDSALEAAMALAAQDRNRVTLSYRGDNFPRTRERNRTRLEAEEKEGKLRVLRSSQVCKITEDSVVLSVQGEQIEIPNDFVFILIGGDSPEEFLEKTGIRIVEKLLAASAGPQ
ncbi:MAG: NAD(P)-binding domain-containing protein [Acidobacteriia bacterium]|nr:NAD(P)-binding domain-containing protein [Terriglobia bacterium]